MSAVLSESDSSAAKRNGAIGWALIALAFAIPFIAVAFGYGSAYSAGYDLARTLGSLAVLALIVWGVTRKRSALAQSNGRIVAGVLLCIVVGSRIVGVAREQEVGLHFLREALALQDRQSVAFDDLGKRFDKVDLSTVLTPENLTTRAGMATARATLAQYRTLLTERRLLVQAGLAESERLFAAIPPGATRDGALSAAGDRAATTKMYGDLDATQTALADEMSAVLDWALTQAGKLGVRDNQLLFATREQQAQLNALLAKLTTAETRMSETAAAATVTHAKAQTKAFESTRQAKELLAK